MPDWHEHGNPFAIPDFQDQAILATTDIDTSFLTKIPILPDLETKYQLPDIDGIKFSIYDPGTGERLERFADLDPVGEDSLEDLGSLTSDSTSFSANDNGEEDLDDDDIWIEAGRLEKEPRPKFRSWERLYAEEVSERQVAYIGESGARIFDALVRVIETNKRKEPSTILLAPPVLEALQALTHARDSKIFSYNASRQTFDVRVPNFRISGFSCESSKTLLNTILQYAINAKRVQELAMKIKASSRSSSASVSLASAALRVIFTIESFYFTTESQGIRSCLQLQSLIERPGHIISELLQLLESTAKHRSDVDVLSKTWDVLMSMIHSQSWMSSIMTHLLDTISRSWSLLIDKALGLSSEETSTLELHSDSNTTLDTMPSWVEKRHVERIEHISSNLELIKRHQADHPLATAPESFEPMSVQTCFGLGDVDRIQKQAARYEADVLVAMENFDSGLPFRMKHTSRPVPADTESVEDFRGSPMKYVAAISAEINDGESPVSSVHGALEDAVRSLIDGTHSPERTVFTLPLSLAVSLHYKSVLDTQARLVNQACLRLILREHHLEAHLMLLHRFFLLRNGVFASRLTHALFDTDLPSSERKKGHQRLGTSGLRLGNRQSWPPASSELRLALSGILIECFESNFGALKLGVHGELPGNLSFSVRPMSAESLQRCMDPNNIEALDFLTVQYSAPEPVNAIITETLLTRYDLVFKQLLRCQRMLHTVKQLCHPGGSRGEANRGGNIHAQRFRIEAQHFVSSICGYFNNRIDENFRLLRARMNEIKAHLEAYSLHDDESPYSLRDLLATTLDRTSSGLFLRNSQAQFSKFLEEIFSLILRFAKEAQSGSATSERYREMYETQHQKIGDFMNICETMSEGQDQAPDDFGHHGGGSTLGHLLLMLNMNNYYEP